MHDLRFAKLSHSIVQSSLIVSPGDVVLVEATDTPEDFVIALIHAIDEAGGLPLVNMYHQRVSRALYSVATEKQMRLLGLVDRTRMEAVDCYVAIRANNNSSELSDVPSERMAIYEMYARDPVHTQVRMPQTRWLVLRWPTASMAQSADMSTEAFEDFYFRVCANVDYGRMAEAIKPLHALMDRTDKVHIVGPGTDLTFSKKGISTKPCYGLRNLPDGECYSAPIRDSVNGVIQYNSQTLYHGTTFTDIRFVFKDGKIIEATAAGDTEKLNRILGTDEGARYIGEWSLAFNPYILTPMKDTLFDEKIAGSFHLTPGQAYKEADNLNRSQVHWDIVCIQRPEFGGGEIYFDDVLIRKDGIFTLAELQGLNPDNLIV